MKIISFEYRGWEMPPEGFMLFIDEEIIDASLDMILLLQCTGIKISKLNFNYFWEKLRKIKSRKLEKENSSHRIVCDGFRITMRLIDGKKERITYISNPDEEYFKEFKLDECIKWLDLYREILNL